MHLEIIHTANMEATTDSVLRGATPISCTLLFAPDYDPYSSRRPCIDRLPTSGFVPALNSYRSGLETSLFLIFCPHFLFCANIVVHFNTLLFLSASLCVVWFQSSLPCKRIMKQTGFVLTSRQDSIC